MEEGMFSQNNSGDNQAVPVSSLPASKPQKPLIVQILLPLSIIIAAVLVAGSIYFTRAQSGVPSQPKPKITSGDRILGDPKAKVTVFEFSDFQCPYCRKFVNEAQQIMKDKYISSGKVKLVFRHWPLNFHPMAQPSAMAAECAGDQGKFWEAHDKIFGEQEKKAAGKFITVTYTEDELKRWMADIGLDMAVFNICYTTGKFAEKIKADLDSGTSLGVRATPSFFVNNQFVEGAYTDKVFQLIDAALK